ncbi:MAG: TonB family protein, partial [Candidatus Omnitrophota bacterium]
IGGLIKEREDEDIAKLPWFGDLPFIGRLFRHKQTLRGGGAGQRGNMELFITLTPNIIRPKKDFIAKDTLEREQKHVSKQSGLVSTKAVQRDLFSQYYRKRSVPEEMKSYITGVQQEILRNISYPESLKRNAQGRQLLLFLTISSGGTVEDVKIMKSSGYKTLDDDAIKIVKNLDYPPFPSHINLNEINIEIPIVYSARR